MPYVMFRVTLINKANGRWYYSIKRGKSFYAGSSDTLDRAKAFVADWLNSH